MAWASDLEKGLVVPQPCQLYSKFIAGYVAIAAAPNDLTGSYFEWVWTEAEQSSFDRLKAALMDAPVLAIPDLTESSLFVIENRASDIAIGSVLLQY